MKNKVQYVIQSLALLLALTLLFSLVFAALYYFNLIHTQSFHIINWIGGVLAYGVGGFWLGKHVEKKALLHALLVVIPLMFISFLISGISLSSTLEIFSKVLAYLALCILSFTHKAKA